jgi:hypothetical protein
VLSFERLERAASVGAEVEIENALRPTANGQSRLGRYERLDMVEMEVDASGTK